MNKARWYVLHAYSGYEKKVADSILDQATKLGVKEHIEEISVPVQNIVEVKRGVRVNTCLLYTSPSPRDQEASRMPSSA